jgi:hypothetical protein
MEFVILGVGIIIGIIGTWIFMSFHDKDGKMKARAFELRNFLKNIDDRIENASGEVKDRLIKTRESVEKRLKKIEDKLGL